MDNIRILMDLMDIPVFIKDCDGRYTGCNKAFEVFYGVAQKDLIGKTVYDIAPKHLADIYAEADRRPRASTCSEASIRFWFWGILISKSYILVKVRYTRILGFFVRILQTRTVSRCQRLLR
jgi:PAS domain S-box-containing protein